MSYTCSYEHDVTAIRIGKARIQADTMTHERRVLIYTKTRSGEPMTVSLTLFGPEPIGVIIDPDNTDDIDLGQKQNPE